MTLDQSVSTGPTPATLSFTGTVAVLMQPTMTLHLRLVGATPDKLTIAGAHVPFPGIGHVAKASTGYAYVPVQWGADL